MVSVIGIPLDENSSFLKGAALAPRKIMEAYHSDSSNYCTENGVDVSKDDRWKDLGDVTLHGIPRAIDEIEKAVDDELLKNNKVLCFGGDHSVTYPIHRQSFRKKIFSSDHSSLRCNGGSKIFQGNTGKAFRVRSIYTQQKFASHV